MFLPHLEVTAPSFKNLILMNTILRSCGLAEDGWKGLHGSEEVGICFSPIYPTTA